MREWLKIDKKYKNILESCGMNLEFKYKYFEKYAFEDIKPCLNHLLSTELIVKNELNLKKILNKIIIYSSSEDRSIKQEIIKLCKQNKLSNVEVECRNLNQLRQRLKQGIGTGLGYDKYLTI